MPKITSALLASACAAALAFSIPALAHQHGAKGAKDHGGMERTAAPEGASVYFIAPQDGDTVEGPVTIKFGLEGMGIAPAGIEKENTGHHHLLINTTLKPEMKAEPLPADDQHVHFGGGQTQATLDLPAGTHELQLVLGDHNHIVHEPPIVSDVITVTVK